MNSFSERHSCPVVLFLYLCSSVFICGNSWSEEPKRLDPAAWGSDHVGKPLPEYVTGDECLFCHRMDIGPHWTSNRHNRSLRKVEADTPALAGLKRAPGFKEFAERVELMLGDKNRARFLRPSAAYGKLDLLSVSWVPPRFGQAGNLVDTDTPQWNSCTFADSCAGCHATAVDAKTRAFSALSLDCYVCHGDVNLKHSKDPALVHLARKRQDPAPVVTSICAQCHLRTGKSKSSGLPYPNNFVAGDNLFRDFLVDISPAKLQELNPADAHIQENVRDVVVLGKQEVTCLSCHSVHAQSSKQHHLLPKSDVCLHCHQATGPKKNLKRYEVHSRVCGY